MEPTDRGTTEDERAKGDLIVERAYAIVDAHSHFRGRAAQFEFVCREDVLVLRGAVPTFYLKQVLQSVLKDVDGIRVIDNQVTVVPVGTGR
jgi:hypothetical protein